MIIRRCLACLGFALSICCASLFVATQAEAARKGIACSTGLRRARSPRSVTPCPRTPPPARRTDLPLTLSPFHAAAASPIPLLESPCNAEHEVPGEEGEPPEFEPEPCLETLSATAVGTTQATLHGVINPHGLSTTAWFYYSTQPIEEEGDVGGAATPEIGVSGSTNTSIEASITGLLPGTTYHFELNSGKVYEEEEANDCIPICASGNVLTFTTQGEPPPPPPPPPGVETGDATTKGYHSALLQGTVNPHGYPTDYYFEYGETTAYGGFAPLPPPGRLAGGSVFTLAVDAEIAVRPGATYHYRLVADRNGAESQYGNDRTVTIPIPPPVVTTDEASNLGEHQATLRGIINPEGFSTTYQFEYWPTANSAEVSRIPVPPEAIGAGMNSISVARLITNLVPFTEYAFRLVASSAGGTAPGHVKIFTTGPALVTSEVPLPIGASQGVFNGSSCTTSNACSAVGSYVNPANTRVPLAERWSGAAWTVQEAVVPIGAKEAEFKAVSCTATNDCLAVGSYYANGVGLRTLVESWNGSVWAIQPSPTPSTTYSYEGATLTSVSCPNTTHCMAVGYTEETRNRTFAEYWNGSEWTLQTIPQDEKSPYNWNRLYGVSCASASDCEAVGSSDYPLIAHWDGTSWRLASPANSTEPAVLTAIDCTTTSACTAVGEHSNHTLAERWNGTTWTAENTPTPAEASASRFLGVSCPSTSACTAVGVADGPHGPYAAFWSGPEWRPQATGAVPGTEGELNAVSCASEAACVAVGAYKNAEQDLMPLGQLEASPGTVTEGAVSVGSRTASVTGTVNPYGAGTTYRFEYGTTTAYGSAAPIPSATLASQLMPEKVQVQLSHLLPSTTYHYRIVANNRDGSTYGEDRTLTTLEGWMTAAVPFPNGAYADQLDGVSCASERACMAVGWFERAGSSRRPFAERWNGMAWTSEEAVMPVGAQSAELQAVSCAAASNCIAVGGYYAIGTGLRTLAEHWDGTAWATQASPTPNTTYSYEGATLTSVSCPNTTHCMAVGYTEETRNRTFAEYWNGSEWTLQTIPQDEKSPYNWNRLYGVSCASASDCEAVGSSDYPLIAHWDGTSWRLASPANSTEPAVLTAIDCTTTSACTAVGEHSNHTLAERWNGTTWTAESTPARHAYRSVSCPLKNSCTAVGWETEPLPIADSWNGVDWIAEQPERPARGTGEFLSVSCVSAATCVAVGRSVRNHEGFIQMHVRAPLATTESVTNLTASSATLRGNLMPYGEPTTYEFEYGTTTAYGNVAPAAPGVIVTENTAEDVVQPIAELATGTTYHYRVVATNASGTTYGKDRKFTTK